MGTNTVASMVVFEGGAPKKSDYRRFKIRGDFAEPAAWTAMAMEMTRALADHHR